MKKVILPLLLILAFSFLVAVESDPSAVVGYVRYDVSPGLNLVALPMDQGFTLASEFGAYAGANIVQKWDPVSAIWNPTITEAFPGWWDDDFAVGPGDVLLINIVARSPLYSVGSLPAPATYSLVAGLNAVMIPLNRSDLTTGSATGTDIGANIVQMWDPAAAIWNPTITEAFPGWWDDDFAVSIGLPLLVNVNADTTWPSRTATKAILTGSK